jgi:hypothetical protein
VSCQIPHQALYSRSPLNVPTVMNVRHHQRAGGRREHPASGLSRNRKAHAGQRADQNRVPCRSPARGSATHRVHGIALNPRPENPHARISAPGTHHGRPPEPPASRDAVEHTQPASAGDSPGLGGAASRQPDVLRDGWEPVGGRDRGGDARLDCATVPPRRSQTPTWIVSPAASCANDGPPPSEGRRQEKFTAR